MVFIFSAMYALNVFIEQIGIPNTMEDTFLAMARQGIFFIPAVLILSNLLGLQGIQMSQAAADLLTLVCAVPIQLKALKTLGPTGKNSI